MSVELKRISTIPVYRGLTPLESWDKIVEADGKPITGPFDGHQPIDGWANIGMFVNSQGDVAIRVLPLEEKE